MLQASVPTYLLPNLPNLMMSLRLSCQRSNTSPLMFLFHMVCYSPIEPMTMSSSMTSQNYTPASLTITTASLNLQMAVP